MEQRSKIKNIFDKYKSVMNDDLRWKQISNEFAELIGVTSNREQRPLVIYGAGVVTLPSILELLNIYDIHPVAISDTDSNKWGRRIKDIPVNSIDEIKLTYGTDVTIIIAVRGNHNDRIKINDKLKELGYKHIVQCDTWLKYREILKLKDYNLMVDKNDEAIVDSFENIQWLYEKFEDELSKKTLEEIVLARLIPYEYEYRYHENGYFMEHLFSKDAYKYVVDCGAYRGDTLSEFIEVHNLEGILQQYHAFEIDPFNIYKLND